MINELAIRLRNKVVKLGLSDNRDDLLEHLYDEVEELKISYLPDDQNEELVDVIFMAVRCIQANSGDVNALLLDKYNVVDERLNLALEMQEENRYVSPYVHYDEAKRIITERRGA